MWALQPPPTVRIRVPAHALKVALCLVVALVADSRDPEVAEQPRLRLSVALALRPPQRRVGRAVRLPAVAAPVGVLAQQRWHIREGHRRYGRTVGSYPDALGWGWMLGFTRNRLSGS